MKRVINSIGIGIECNPSSNVLIGTFSSYNIFKKIFHDLMEPPQYSEAAGGSFSKLYPRAGPAGKRISTGTKEAFAAEKPEQIRSHRAVGLHVILRGVGLR